jgi:tetratricopeptide (TPR) repeat protein
MLLLLPMLAALASQSCEASLAQATAALRRNNATEAWSNLDAAPSDCSHAASFYALRGVASELLGNAGRAEDFLLQAVTIEPQSEKLHEQLGALFLRHGKSKEAIPQLTRVVSLAPENVTAKKYLIGAYIGTNDWQPAARLFDQLGGRPKPGSEPITLIWFAQALAGTGQFERLLRDLPPTEPDIPPAVLFSVGQVLAQAARYEKAIAYWRAIPAASADDAVCFNLGLAYSHLGQFDKARRCYFLAIDKHPDYADAYLRVGLDYGASGEGRKALPWLSRAHQISSGRPDIVYAFSEQLIQFQYFNTAEQVLSANTGSPNPGELLRVAKADLQRAKGKVESATTEYEAVLRTRPGCVPALVGLAKAKLQIGRDDEAGTYLSKALAANPNDPDVAGQLGLVYLRQEQWDSAAKYLKLAWNHNKNDSALAVGLSRVLRHTSQPDEALKILEFCRTESAQTPAFHLELAQVYTQLHRSDMADAERATVSRLKASEASSLHFDQPGTYVQ